jgi:hypothetical protein
LGCITYNEYATQNDHSRKVSEMQENATNEVIFFSDSYKVTQNMAEV